jgi:hypothetical protein
MIRSVNLALTEAENTRRAASRAGRPARHPLVEYYGDWERARAGATQEPAASYTISLTGDDDGC